MNTSKRKVFILSIILIFTFNSVFCQAIQKGLIYVLKTDEYIPVKYSKKYTKTTNEFITKYIILHPTKGYPWLTVTAVHNRSTKTIKVNIDDLRGSVFSHITDEIISYEIASGSLLGFRGDVGILAGNRVPNQLMVQFASSVFENINVINVLGSEKSDFDHTIYFILDKKNSNIEKLIAKKRSERPIPTNPLLSKFTEQEIKEMAIVRIKIPLEPKSITNAIGMDDHQFKRWNYDYSDFLQDYKVGALYNLRIPKEKLDAFLTLLPQIEMNSTNYKNNIGIRIKNEPILNVNVGLLNPDSVLYNHLIVSKIRAIIEENDSSTNKIEKVTLRNGDVAYSIGNQGTPVYSFCTKSNSYQVDEFDHWTSASIKSIINFYSGLGYEKYTSENYNTNTVRFKNKSGNIFIMVNELSKSKRLITISCIEMVDEIEE